MGREAGRGPFRAGPLGVGEQPADTVDDPGFAPPAAPAAVPGQARRAAVAVVLSPASFTAATAEGARMRIPDALGFAILSLTWPLAFQTVGLRPILSGRVVVNSGGQPSGVSRTNTESFRARWRSP